MPKLDLEHKTITSGGGVLPNDEEGVVEALVSVTGIKDNVDDIIAPGAYEKTLKSRMPKGVWSHDWNTPVSKVEEIKELLPGDEMLPKTLSNGDPWPNEAGALYVKARFNLNTQAGRDAYENVKFFGDTAEWSIGYKVPKGQARRTKDGTRHIKSLELFEFSPVLFGAASEARSLVTSIKSMFGSEDEWKKALEEAFSDEGEEKCDHHDEDDTDDTEEAIAPAAVTEEAPADEQEKSDDDDTEEKVDEVVETEEKADDEVTDEELIALITEDESEKTETRSEAKSVALTPVILEQLQNLQNEIKTILDVALTVEPEEKETTVDEIESKSVEDAVNGVAGGELDEKVSDEIVSAVEKYNTAVSAKDEEGVKTHSIAVLDLIDANLSDVSEDVERELKTLAKAIGDDVAAFESAPEEAEEEKSDEEAEESKSVKMTEEEFKALLGI